MKKQQSNLKTQKESRIIQTKADKIIFSVSVVVYTVLMFLELKFTPHHNTISSCAAAVGIGIFLISKAIHIKRTRELIFTKDRVLWLLMPVIAAALIIFAGYWLVSEYLL
jgi:NADH:ubiquinone oxidoreductase subunit H